MRFLQLFKNYPRLTTLDQLPSVNYSSSYHHPPYYPPYRSSHRSPHRPPHRSPHRPSTST